MTLLQEFHFHPTDRTIPLDQPPMETLPQWGHWLETPEYVVAMIPPGHLEVNLRSPLNLAVTSFGVTRGVAAFDSDRLNPYEALPGGFDIVPQGSTYRSVEDASCFVVFGYSQAFLSRLVTDGEGVELLPGQIARTHWGLRAAIATQEFFYNGQIGGAFYLESIVTAVLGQIVYRHSSLSHCLRRPPEFLEPALLKTVLDYVQTNVAQPLSLRDIAAIAHFSPYYFARAFKATTGISLYQYVLQCRVKLAQRLLRDRERSLAQVAVEAGFGNQSHMTTVFRRVLQTTPKQFRLSIEE